MTTAGKSSKRVAIGLTAVHVAAFAQLGVLTREYLDKFFQDGCTGGWGLCLTSSGAHTNTYGAYFTDIPSNSLGSFLMGLLATSATLGLADRKAAAALPARHPWQANAPLLVGLRTGFCGSLTTFSAWQLQELLLLVGGRGRDGGQWAQALWALVIGLQTSLASLVLGHHAALAVHRWLLQEGRHASLPDGAHPTAVPSCFRGRGALLLASRRSLDGVANGAPGSGNAAAAAAAAGKAEPRDGLAGRQQEVVAEAADEETALEDTRATAAAEITASWHRGRKTHAAVGALLVLLTALFTTLCVVDDGRQHAERRAIWLAVLVGQFGALLRWQLAAFNGRLPGGHSWFPTGTFAANLIACVIIFAAQVPGDVRVLGYWPQILVLAVQKGFCGALSTVSTFVNEIHAMYDVFPDRLHAYKYIFVSVGAAWVAGVVIYGAPAWAHM